MTFAMSAVFPPERNLVVKFNFLLSVKGVILVAPQINQTAADTSPVVCVSLIQDTQTNGAVYNSEDVYSNFSNEAGQNCNALRNPSYVERFKVIKTLCFNLPQLPITYDGANIEQPGLTIPFTLSKKLNFHLKCFLPFFFILFFIFLPYHQNWWPSFSCN